MRALERSLAAPAQAPAADSHDVSTAGRQVRPSWEAGTRSLLTATRHTTDNRVCPRSPPCKPAAPPEHIDAPAAEWVAPTPSRGPETELVQGRGPGQARRVYRAAPTCAGMIRPRRWMGPRPE